jgi:hypothetical protein
MEDIKKGSLKISAKNEGEVSAQEGRLRKRELSANCESKRNGHMEENKEKDTVNKEHGWKERAYRRKQGKNYVCAGEEGLAER